MLIVRSFMLLAAASCILGGKQDKKYTISFENAKNCKGYDNANFHIYDNNFPDSVVQGQLWNCKLHIGKVPEKIRAVVDVSSCRAIDGQGCDHFIRTRHDLCDVLKDKDQFYTPVFHAVKPRVYCPIKEGTYTMTNATVAPKKVIDILKSFPGFTDIHWKLKLRFFERIQDTLGCLVLLIKINEASSVKG